MNCARNVGMIFQHFNLMKKTAYENVALLFVIRLNEERQKNSWSLELVDFVIVPKTILHSCQVVHNVARALANDPESYVQMSLPTQNN